MPKKMEIYLPIIKRINKSIENFNTYLSDIAKISKLSENDLENKNSFTNLTLTDWYNTRFPNDAGQNGVYFLFGYNKINENELGFYIGKASLQSKMGNRLWTHLNRYKDSEQYLMKNIEGEEFVLEFIAAISTEKNKIGFIAPALEEFLILNLKNDHSLLNASGNF